MADDSAISLFQQMMRNRQLQEEHQHARIVDNFREFQELPDDELIGLAVRQAVTATQLNNPGFEMEMQRRLKDAVETLTAETIKSRESSAMLSAELHASVASLTAETVIARKSSDRAARRLVWLTVVLVVLTAALVALTVVLAVSA